MPAAEQQQKGKPQKAPQQQQQKKKKKKGNRWAFAAFASAAAVAVLFLARVPCVGDSGAPSEADTHAAYVARYARFFPDAAALERRRADFLAQPYARGYGYDSQLEATVVRELARLDGEAYADYTGAGVYQGSAQLGAAFAELQQTAYGNAHSQSPSSLRTEQTVADMRQRVLRHFNVTGAEYTVIFTAGATGALKLVGESFPWSNTSRFVYLRSNHNSVLGIREIALDRGADFAAVPESAITDRGCNVLTEEPSSACLERQRAMGQPHRPATLTEYPEGTFHLFAYPAMDNYAGVKYPLEWIDRFHAASDEGHGRWFVLLDAAAYVPTSGLDLHKHPADFVPVSFYKMFGYPTGLGVLLVRNEAIEVMQKTFFGGGTVVLSSCDSHFCLLQQNPCMRFEDGTISFLSISSLRYGFEALERFGMDAIAAHTAAIREYFFNELAAMRHSNGQPFATIFGKHNRTRFKPETEQGAIVNFILHDSKGAVIGYRAVQDATSEEHVHIRTGCNCNPGGCFDYLGVTSEEVVKYSLEKTSCGDELDLTDEGKPLGSVRVSFGYLSTFEDARAVLDVLARRFLQ